MTRSLLIASLLAVALAACGKKEEPAPAPAPAAEAPAAPAPAAPAADAAAPAAPAADAAARELGRPFQFVYRDAASRLVRAPAAAEHLPIPAPSMDGERR